MTLDPATASDLRIALATVAAIPVTPFGPGGDPDWDAHARIIGRMLDAGLTLITPNGNTGEFTTLNAGETRQAVVSAARACDGRAELLAGIGLDVTTAIAAGEQARELGARMVMIHQPASPYLSAAGWLDYHVAVASALPDLGVILYIRDARITGAHIAALADACPNVLGVKYGVRDPVLMAAVVRDAGPERFTWLAGLAELTAPFCWTAGARGFPSGLVNVAPGLARSMLTALRDSDAAGAMKIWELVRPFEELRAADSSADNVSVVKEALAQLGLCRPDVRPPSHPVSPPVRERIREILVSWGIGPS
jgi:4-hydroxy-tetrahydrodipicolinate synthase